MSLQDKNQVPLKVISVDMCATMQNIMYSSGARR